MKVLTLYHSLSDSEREDFRLWLFYELRENSSETLAQKQNPHKLIVYLELILEKGGNVREHFHYLFPNQPYNDNKVREIRNLMLEKLSTFLAISQLKPEKYALSVAYLKALLDRNLHDLFLKEFKKVEKALKKDVGTHVRIQGYLYEIYQLKKQLLVKRGAIPDNQSEQDIIDSFNQWIAEEKLQLILMKINYERVSGELLTDDLADTFLGFVLSKENHSSLLLKLLYQTYLLIGEKLNDTGQQALISLLKQGYNHIHHIPMTNLYNLITNHYIRYLNQEESHGKLNMLYQLYLWGLETKLLFIDQKLPASHYRNLQKTCIILGLYDEAEKHIENFSKFLDPEKEQPEDVIHYSQADLLLAQGNALEAQKVLHNKKFRSPNIDVAAKALEIRARYLTTDVHNYKEFEFFQSKVDANIRSLKRKKDISEGRRHAYLVFYNLLRKLAEAESDVNLGVRVKKLEALLIKANTQKPFYAHSWLIGEIQNKIAALQHS